MKEYEQAPDKEFCLASFEMKLPPQQFENGKTQKAVLSVQAAGKISTWGSRKYPIAKLKAVLVVGEQRKECAYPFECDSIGTSLMDDQPLTNLQYAPRDLPPGGNTFHGGGLLVAKGGNGIPANNLHIFGLADST